MTGIRANIIDNKTAADAFLDGVRAMKEETLGTTTAELGLPGPAKPVSTYDLFVVWHHLAMMRNTPPDHQDRNLAHSGPSFLPWHRLMLMHFEVTLQRLLGNSEVGLPYWDWAVDGDLVEAQQPKTPIWGPDVLGGSGTPVPDGPFSHDRFVVQIETGPTGALRTVERGLTRRLAEVTPALPSSADVAAALNLDEYDTDPWDRTPDSFRNRVEGWRPRGPQLHNRVHVWVHGDMAPASSPNDPVFYLNHCNVDRLWEAWMQRHGRNYGPGPDAADTLAGHRLNDQLYTLVIDQAATPASVLDVSTLYQYDRLP